MPPPAPYERRMDAPAGDGPAKKRRKGATRLSCAECRRYTNATICRYQCLYNFYTGSNYAAIEPFHAAPASNEGVELSALM